MEQKKIKERTQKHLDDYARRGLRTLCIAKKVLTFFICVCKNVYLQSMANRSGVTNGADLTTSEQMLPLPHFIFPEILSAGIFKLAQIN